MVRLARRTRQAGAIQRELLRRPRHREKTPERERDSALRVDAEAEEKEGWPRVSWPVRSQPPLAFPDCNPF